MTNTSRDEFDEQAAELLPCATEFGRSDICAGPDRPSDLTRHASDCPAWFRIRIAQALRDTARTARGAALEEAGLITAQIADALTNEGDDRSASEVYHRILLPIRTLITDPPAPQSGWRDMASAPQDGTSVLLCWPYWSRCAIIGWCIPAGTVWDAAVWDAAEVASHGDDADPGPTHWQPLDPLPTDSPDAEKRESAES
jgi:hypothetical protein